MMMGCWIAMCLASAADAADVDQVLQRVTETREHRGLRLTPDAPSVQEDEYREAASGKIVTGVKPAAGAGVGKAYGVAVVDLPIGDLWSAVNDTEGQKPYSRMAYVEVVKGSKCESGRTILQVLPLPMVADRWWISDLTMNRALHQASQGRMREMSWESTNDRSAVTSEEGKKHIEAGTPVASSVGGWLLIDIDGSSTLIEYTMSTDPGGWIPSGLTTSFAAGGIKDNIRAIESFAREGAACPR